MDIVRQLLAQLKERYPDWTDLQCVQVLEFGARVISVCEGEGITREEASQFLGWWDLRMDLLLEGSPTMAELEAANHAFLHLCESRPCPPEERHRTMPPPPGAAPFGHRPPYGQGLSVGMKEKEAKRRCTMAQNLALREFLDLTEPLRPDGPHWFGKALGEEAQLRQKQEKWRRHPLPEKFRQA